MNEQPTREMLTAALERLGYSVEIIPEKKRVWDSGSFFVTVKNDDTSISVRKRTAKAALDFALRELVPLAVLVRAVMGEGVST